MARRLMALAVAAAAPLALAPPAAAQPPRPNVVVVMTDDQTLASLGTMSRVRDLIGAQGTTFERAISTFPLCCPSRATYLTGQYAHNHGVIHNAGPFGGHARLDHGNTLPVWLQAAGYRTIQLGRYLNGYGNNGRPPTEVPPGWSDWHATIDPSTFNFVSWQMNDDGNVSDYPKSRGEHQNDFFGRRAAELIEEAAPSPQPFFLSLTFPAPHSGRPRDPDDPAVLSTPSPAARHRDAFAQTPLPRTPNFDEEDVSDKPQVVFDRPRLTAEQVAAVQENYQQELESLLSVDEAVGSLVGALSRSGELENTLLIYTSDNGFMHGEHRLPSEKVVPYESSIRVPLLMRGPGVPRGRRLRQLVGNVDLASTILEAAGGTPARVQDGRSLFPLMRDPGLEWGRELLIENGQGANGVSAYRGVRNDRFLYVEHLTTGELELYDLRRDPFQLRNLDGHLRYEVVQAALSRRLRRLTGCRGSRCAATRPSLRLLTHGPSRPARAQPRCLSGDLRLRVKGSDAAMLERVEVFLGRRRVARDRRAPFVQTIKRRAFRRGREVLMRVRATTLDGRVRTLDRRSLACR